VKSSSDLAENFTAERLDVHVRLYRHSFAVGHVAPHRKVSHICGVSVKRGDCPSDAAVPLFQQPGAGCCGLGHHFIARFKDWFVHRFASVDFPDDPVAKVTEKIRLISGTASKKRIEKSTDSRDPLLASVTGYLKLFVRPRTLSAGKLFLALYAARPGQLPTL
jgi:hypothetical protein